MENIKEQPNIIRAPIKEIDLDEIMDELGSFGKFQIEIFLYLSFPILLKAMYNTQYVFAAGQTDYRCRVPQCESFPETYDIGDWGKFALPPNCFDCYRKKAIGPTCEPSSFTDEIERCYSWVYENDNTIVYEFDLACEEWKRTLVGTIHNFGYFCALPAVAYFSDAWGRGRVLIFTAILPAFFGVGRAFVNNYYLYVVIEYLESFTGSGTYSTAFILGLEMVSIKNRVCAGNLLVAIFAIGQGLSGFISYMVPYWRLFTLVIYTPSFIFFSYICLYKESLRWLLAKGKKKEAIKKILRAARINRKRLSLKTMAMLMEENHNKVGTSLEIRTEDDENKEELPELATRKRSIWKQMLNSKTMMFRICICSYAWATMNLIYYGLSINSVSLAGNRYANFVISSLIEIPGNMLSALTLNRYGRKSCICIADFLCGLSLIMTGVISGPMTINSFTMFGKLCISFVSCSTFIYTVELFPTQARHFLLSICSVFGRLGSMIAPQTPLLMSSSETMPNIIFGILAATAGLLLLLMPETLKMKLPDTIEQAENLKMMPRTLRKTDVLSGEVIFD